MHQLAVRTACYGPQQAAALAHLARLGVVGVELRLPPVEQVPALLRHLDRCHLRAVTLQGHCDLANPAVATQIADQLPLFAELNCRHMLVVTRAGNLPSTAVVDRLRTIGDVLAPAGVTLLLETHPDLTHTAAAAHASVGAANHPQIRVNFDPANLYYFNASPEDPVASLQQQLPLLGGVHLKDTRGGFEQRPFPALGEGVVDLGGLKRTLAAAGWSGPLTLELDGMLTPDDTFTAVCDRVERSLTHWRDLPL